jgi:NitT/TauT family transport system substrate-binding protein
VSSHVCKLITLALVALLCSMPGFALAGETVTVVVPDRGAWDSSYTELGIQQGLFEREGLDVRVMYVNDEAALENALSSGKADIAVAADFIDIVGAWRKGAPIRIISPESTGAPDIFWFAKVVGPVASMGDLHGQPVGYSKPGSTDYFIMRALLKEAGVDDARLVSIGSADAGYPDVLSAQLAASWSKPPANVNYLIAGEIRIIARGNDSTEIRNETVRVNVANSNFLAGHRSAVIGFLKAYKKSVDWAYSSQLALSAYAKLSDQSLDAAKYIFKEFTSRKGAQIDEIKGEERVLANAFAANRIPTAMTHMDISGLYDLALKQAPQRP